MESTDRFKTETARHQAAGFKPRPGGVAWMRRSAAWQREKHGRSNPYYPGIRCARCDKMAIEGSFFCEDH